MNDIKYEENHLIDIFKKYILSSREVINKGFSDVLGENEKDTDYIRNNFSLIITSIQKRAYDVFLESQQIAWSKAVREYLEENMNENITRTDVTNLLIEKFEEFDSFFLSLTNSRRARAGSTFQSTIKKLFRKLNYPFKEQANIDGKPDFLLPNEEYFRENPADCIIFTAKRTLRERWRQIVTEGTRGLGYFLATIDESITVTQLAEMSSNRIYLVVPKDLKQGKSVYKKASNVITFENFFLDFLDPAHRRWKRIGII